MEIMKKKILRVSFLRAIASRARSITGPRKDSILIFIQDFFYYILHAPHIKTLETYIAMFILIWDI